MAGIRWFQSLMGKKEVPYVDESESKDETVSVKDLLRFMEKQQEQNSELLKAVLENSAAQSRTLENYIELFKPKYVPSTTLSEREQLKQEKMTKTEEWERIDDLKKFNALTSVGIPPEPGDF